MKNVVEKYLEPIAFILLFYLTIIRIVFFGGWVSISGSTFEKVLPEFILWILDGILFFWIANQKKNIRGYLLTWRRNWILLGFILFAICSIFWSDFVLASLYKVFVLIACSVIAGYIGISYTITNIVRKLYWFFVIIVSLSYGLAMLFPSIGTHIGYPYFGAWRGLFFAKNYMGAVMALGTIVFLLNIFSVENKIIIRLLSSCLYLLTVGLVFLSQSATGIILFIILNSGFLLFIAWAKWNKHLRGSHYIILGILFTGIIILALSHLDFIFGLLNRNTTLTGRIPLWSFLIENGISKNPLFGSGFGATWANDQFRSITQSVIGWEYAPIVADNGLIDIFLNLGLIGVVMLSSIVGLCSYRTAIYALKEQTIKSFFPVLVMIFVIMSNISVSFILELESFAWFLMVFALFSTMPDSSEKQVNVGK